MRSTLAHHRSVAIRGPTILHVRSIAYQPALDGVRAVAVALVLAFHAGMPWMPAGYLGVSVFFTLSGYLITGLLLTEHAATQRIDLGAFYGRRLRRLLPASLLCVMAILVARWMGAFGQVQGLRGDAIGAVLQVFNWVKLAGSTSYGDLFGGVASPLEHYWSLSIEEQFYWLWPLALWGLLRLRRTTAAVSALTVLVSLGAVVIAAVLGPDAAYWATPARLPEILLGAALACLMNSGRAVPKRAATWAPVALTIIVVLSCTLPSGSGPAYEGALPLFALVSASLVWSLQVPGTVRRVLALRPVVWVGKVSYGLYLFHWPVFALLRERGWVLTRMPDLVVALCVTVAMAVLSYRIVEQPVRAATWRPARTVRLAAVTSAMVLVVAAFVSPAAPFIEADDELLDAASIAPSESLESLAPVTTALTTTSSSTTTASSTSTATGAPTTTFVTQLPLPPAPSRPVRIVVAGDSTALYVAQGLAAWAVAHPEQAQVTARWCQGCTFMLEPAITTFELEGVLEQSNITIGTNLPTAIDELQPDEVLLMVTVSDIADRQWSVEEGPLDPLDPRFRQRMAQAYTALTNVLLDHGVSKVVWVVPPVPRHVWKEPAMNESERYLVQHDVIREVVSGFDERVVTVDLDTWLTAAGHVTDDTWRTDGVHFSDESAEWLAEQYLGPFLVDLAVRS